MDLSLLVWGLSAIVIFWCVGLYNRLMRMRARSLGALGSVEKQMRAYALLAREQLATRNVGVAYGTGHHGEDADREWDELSTRLNALEKWFADVGAMHLASASSVHIAKAFDDVQEAWRQLNNLPSDLAGPLVPAHLHMQLDAIADKVKTARGGFNQIMRLYHEALGQYPAKLVVGLMGFKRGEYL